MRSLFSVGEAIARRRGNDVAGDCVMSDGARRATAITGWMRGASAPLLPLLIAALGVGAAFAGENTQVTNANVLYQTGDYEAALDIYAKLAEERPEDAALQFNQGAAKYQLGDLKQARRHFESASELSGDARLQALSSYNLGNVACKDAEQLAGQDPQEAIAALERGVRHYKKALAKDRGLDGAAKNLEMARRTIQRLREQVQQQQKQQEQQQQQQEDAKKKLDELIEKQNQHNQQSGDAADRKQDPARQDPSPQEMDQQAGQQQQTREETESLAESMESEGDRPTPMDKSREHAEKAAEKQQEAEQQLRNQDPEAANKAQEEALEELEQARSALDEGEEGDEQEQQSGDESEGKNQENPDPQQEQDGQAEDSQEGESERENKSSGNEQNVPPPNATAQDILKQERQNKEARQIRQMIRVQPVEKDW